MDSFYKLYVFEHEQIYTELEQDMLSSSFFSPKPLIYVLGGQPGSGKSGLTEICKEELALARAPFPAIINGDDYRQSHPRSYEIYQAGEKRYSERTDPDARLWTSRLLASAVKNRRNIIFEGTMRNKEPLMSTIKDFKAKGYGIHIMVMSTKSEFSILGIVSRYIDQKGKNGFGRWVSAESHDEAYKNLPETVKAIETGSPIDSIRLYNRDGKLLAEKELETAILKERVRQLTPGEWQKLQEETQKNIERIQSLNISEDDKAIF
jgi:predicted ABC-type ATPase